MEDVRFAEEIEPPYPPVPASALFELFPAIPDAPLKVAPKKSIPEPAIAPPVPPLWVAVELFGLDLAPPPLPPVKYELPPLPEAAAVPSV